MQVAILSDIHGNRHAFEAVLADAEAAGADEMWCLGDLVGYGAEPDACVELGPPPRGDLPGRQPRPGRHRRDRPRRVLDRRRDRRPLDAGDDHATRTWSSCRRCSPPGEEGGDRPLPRQPARPVWEYVLSALLAELCFDVQRPARRAHRPLARRAVVRAPRGRRRDRRAAPRRRRARHRRERRVAAEPRLASASRATATRARPGCCSTPTAGRRSWRRVEYDIAGAAAAIRAARLPDSLAERLGYGQ